MAMLFVGGSKQAYKSLVITVYDYVYYKECHYYMHEVVLYVHVCMYMYVMVVIG